MSPLPVPLSGLQSIAATHADARLYSRARRNLVPRYDRLTAVHGRWAHDHMLRAAPRIETFLWCPGDDATLARDVAGRAAAVAAVAETSYRISARTLARLHPGLSAPALLSVVRLPTWRPSDVLTAAGQLVLVADGIEYAGNLGTLVRTADACGADALVLTSVNARVSHPKVFVASRGTVLTMPLLEYDSVTQARCDLDRAGFTAYVADPAAQRSYRDVDFTAGRCAIVVGSEGGGVASQWRTPAPVRVSIPMLGGADSLNVAVSAAVLLFEARTQLERVAG